MPSLTWLHITDSHIGAPDQSWSWLDIEDRFLESVGRIISKTGPIDLILFTGDLAFSGREYPEAQKFISTLLDKLTSEEAPPLLLAVPGNHDLARPDKDAYPPPIETMSKWGSHPEVQKQFWQRERSPYREAIREVLSDYKEWWSSQPVTDMSSYREGLLPGDFSYTVEKDGIHYGFLGLNTAFLQFADDIREGHLAVSLSQIHSACGGNCIDWAKRHHACFLLTHHPISWLNHASQNDFKEVIVPDRFAVHLFGHLHERRHRSESTGGAGLRRMWQGKSLFGLAEFECNGAKVSRLHGYSVGQIRILTDQTGDIRWWPVSANKLDAGFWNFSPSYADEVLLDDHGTKPEQVRLIKQVDSMAITVAKSLSEIPCHRLDPANPFGVILPQDYVARSLIEDPIRAWYASKDKINTQLHISGGSGTGKSTGLGKILISAFNHEMDVDVVPVWIQLNEQRHPLNAALSIIQSLEMWDPEDPSLPILRSQYVRAEQSIRADFPKILLAASSSSVTGRRLSRSITPGTPNHESSSESDLPLTHDKLAKESEKSSLPNVSSMFELGPTDEHFEPYETSHGRSPNLYEAPSDYIVAESEQIAIYSVFQAPAILSHLARTFADAMSVSRHGAWLFLIDTWDWLQVGTATGAAPNPLLTSSWLADFLLPAVKHTGLKSLVVTAGQVGAEEVNARFANGGFNTSSVCLEGFTEEEFSEFLQSHTVTDTQLLQDLAGWTSRNPQLVRFWLEVDGSSDSDDEGLSTAGRARYRGSEWLFHRIRQRLPNPLPGVIQCASILPAFDRDILESVAGHAFKDEEWNRLRGYGLVETLHHQPSPLFRIKGAFAGLLQSEVSDDRVAKICERAIEALLKRSERVVSGLEKDEVPLQKELSSMLLKAALRSNISPSLIWGLFVRETAKWMEAADVAMGELLIGLLKDVELDAERRSTLAAIGSAWDALRVDHAPRWTPILAAVLKLSTEDSICRVHLIKILSAGLIAAGRLHDFSSASSLLEIAKRRSIDYDETIVLRQCEILAASGDRDGAIGVVKTHNRTNTTSECLYELGRFAYKTLHSTSESVRLYTEALNATPPNIDAVEPLAFILANTGRDEEAIRIAEDTARRNPSNPIAPIIAGWARARSIPGDFKIASDWLYQALQLRPDVRHVCLSYAHCTERAFGAIECRSRLEQLCDDFPRSAALADATARVFGEYDEKDWNKAADWHERSVRLMPDEEDMVAALAYSVMEAEGPQGGLRRLKNLADEFTQSASLASHVGQALADLDDGNWEKALELHERAIRLKPDDESIIKRYKNTVLNRRDAPELTRRVISIAEENPSSPWLAELAGALLQDSKPDDPEASLHWLERAVRMLPKNRRLVERYATALRNGLRTEDARSRIESLAAEYYESAWILDEVGKSYGGLEPVDWQSASKWHEKAALLDPTEERIVQHLAYTLKQSIDTHQVRNRLSDAAERIPDGAWLADYTGRSYANDEPKNLNAAARWFLKALTLQPDTDIFAIHYWNALRDSEGEDQIPQRMEELVAEFPDSPWLLAGLGESLESKTESDRLKRMHLLEQAVRLRPDEGPLVNSYREALQNAIGIVESRHRLAEFAACHPENEKLIIALGLSFTEEDPQDHHEAEKWFERLFRCDPNNKGYIGEYIRAINRTRDVTAARELLEKLAQEYPNSGWLAENLGRLYGANEPRNYAKAAAWHEKALRLLPSEREIVTNYMVMITESRGASSAVDRLEQLRGEFPDNPWIAESLGRVHTSAGLWDVKRAAYWYEIALRLRPQDETLVKDLCEALLEAEGVTVTRERMEALATEFSTCGWLASYTGLCWGSREPKEWSRATQWHEKAVRLLPSERQVVQNYYVSLSNSEHIATARERLEQLNIDFPDNSWLAEVAGVIHGAHEPRDWSKAASWFQRAIRLEPDDKLLSDCLLDALSKSEDPHMMRRRMETLAAEFPTSGWLAASTSQSYGAYEPRDWRKASEWQEKAVRLLPSERDVVHKLYFALTKAVEIVEARSRFDQLSVEFSDSPWIAEATGLIHGSREPRNWKRAAESFECAVRLKPDEMQLVRYLSDSLLKSEGVTALRDRLESLALEHPDSGALAGHLCLAYANVEPKDWKCATKWSEKALRLLPNDRSVVHNFFTSITETEDIAGARSRLEQLCVDYPQSAWIAEAAGIIHAAHEPKNWERAADWFEKAVRLLPDDKDLVALLFEALLQSRGIEAQRTKLQELANEFPHSARLADVVGYSYSYREPKDHLKAAEFSEKAVRLKPQEREFVSGLYVSLYMTGDIPAARSRLEKLAIEFPDSAWIAEMAGFIYSCHEPRNWVTAATWFERAFRSKPDDKSLSERLAKAVLESEGLEGLHRKLEAFMVDYPQNTKILTTAFASQLEVEHPKAAITVLSRINTTDWTHDMHVVAIWSACRLGVRDAVLRHFDALLIGLTDTSSANEIREVAEAALCCGNFSQAIEIINSAKDTEAEPRWRAIDDIIMACSFAMQQLTDEFRERLDSLLAPNIVIDRWRTREMRLLIAGIPVENDRRLFTAALDFYDMEISRDQFAGILADARRGD